MGWKSTAVVFIGTLVLALASGGAGAGAACKEEVAAAFAKLREAGAFRVNANMASPGDSIEMTVEYLLPGRVRQILRAGAKREAVETVFVENRAWTRTGSGAWAGLSPELVSELRRQIGETVFAPSAGDLDGACPDKVFLGGREVLAYRAGGRAAPPAAAAKESGEAASAAAVAHSVRVFYVDPSTGRPLRSTVSLAGSLDKPFFTVDYSYPADIRIEVPVPESQ